MAFVPMATGCAMGLLGMGGGRMGLGVPGRLGPAGEG